MGNIFGTNEQFNLERLPFSARGAFLSIYQELSDKKMYLTLSRGNKPIVDRPNLLQLQLVSNKKPVDFTYACTPSKLSFTAKEGTVEFAYEKDPSIMRVRAKGVALEVYFKPGMHEAGFQFANGDIEIGFFHIGKLKFSEISGTMKTNLKYCYQEVRPYPMTIELIPDNETGVAEMAIFEYDSTSPHRDGAEDFDKVVADKQKEFDDFCTNYGEIPGAYKEMAKKAAYMVWSSTLGPRGALTQPLVYMHKLYMNRAFGWQQCFHAMAMKKNVHEAWRLLTAFFDYQNAIGGLPDHVSDLAQISYITTKPPIQGYATLYILDNYDAASLTEGEYRRMYDVLSKYTNWWFTHHDHSNTGYPSYYHPDESGYDESSTFNMGLPIVSPDLMAYTVFNCEACARLAGLLGDEENKEMWLAKAQKVLDYLINELWDGEQFLAYLPGTKEFYKCGSITQLQPIMLGARLPEGIRTVLKNRLMDSEQFLTDYGTSTENLTSEKLVMRSFTKGAVVAPSQFFIINGLYDAGFKEDAQALCYRYLNALLHKGLALGIHSYRVEPVLGNEIQPICGAMSVSWPFTSWTSSIFIALAERII